ncbi:MULTISPECIES: hypothetical protein [Haloferax]|uniref:Uncharacterized protein n=1 Tax=Haloferax marinum TaxID=2666143 RepID=A0A6A8GAF9_9EURY|nr:MULTISPECIES: hypothetical protein [Haloferax]KAB1190669.1 hypothetical protein Hfx1150_16660 [Haloferax sp. CBA1150]MRW98199.1 hypothetical protein [Haloferax marinum]
MTKDGRRWVGLLFGLGLTSTSLSSGFIWACGADCVKNPVVWTEPLRIPLVFVASFLAWWGYLLAHQAWTGQFVDESAFGDTHSQHHTDVLDAIPIPNVVGVAAGVAVLVVGMVVGVVYIRQGNHLMTNLGGVCFLGGFVIAHYFETGSPL